MGMRRSWVVALTATALAACTSSGHQPPRPDHGSPPATRPSASTPIGPSLPESVRRRVIAIDGYAVGRLANLDPATLRPTGPRRLRLTDYPSSQVLSPDGTTIAFGTVNTGTIITFDPGTFTQTGALHVLHGGNYVRELELVSWPTERLIVGVAQGVTAHRARPGQLLLIDPAGGHVRRQLRLHGTAIAEAAAADGTAVVLVGHLNNPGPARLFVVDGRGRIRSALLPGVKAGGREADAHWPGLVVHGRTAYVVGEGEAMTTVDLDSLQVRMHRVPGLMVEHIAPLLPAMTPGSGGIFRSIFRSATWVAPHVVHVSGYDNLPADGGTRNQSVSHPAMLVDTQTWRISRVFHGVERVESVRSGYIEWRSAYAHGQVRSLAAVSASGYERWRRQLRDTFASLYGGRLIVSHVNRPRSQELDVRTGRVLREIGRWDHKYLIMWSLADGMSVSDFS